MMSNYFINQPSYQIPGNFTTTILKNSNALFFHQSLPIYQPTPLVHLPALAKHFGVAAIYIKDESYRFGLNAFKALGASYAIHELLKKQPDIKTFCTATDGNHGRAVAWSAKQAGKEAVVFVPKGTTSYRIKAIENEGAEAITINGNYDETCAHAEAISKEKGWQLVQDTAWEGYEEIPAYIMAGYITHFAELENSLHMATNAEIDFVFLQAGVGSWAAAAVWYYLNRYGNSRPKLIIVEPAASDGILESFRQGHRSNPKGNLQTIMAGLNCGIPSTTGWDIIKEGVDAAMKVDDSFAMQAMRLLHTPKDNDPQIIAGESGVGGLAGFIALMEDDRYKDLKNAIGINKNSNILLYSTEGATDPDNYKAITALS
jgi:diaminopropionate ammonia-lyase